VEAKTTLQASKALVFSEFIEALARVSHARWGAERDTELHVRLRVGVVMGKCTTSRRTACGSRSVGGGVCCLKHWILTVLMLLLVGCFFLSSFPWRCDRNTWLGSLTPWPYGSTSNYEPPTHAPATSWPPPQWMTPVSQVETPRSPPGAHPAADRPSQRLSEVVVLVDGRARCLPSPVPDLRSWCSPHLTVAQQHRPLVAQLQEVVVASARVRVQAPRCWFVWRI